MICGACENCWGWWMMRGCCPMMLPAAVIIGCGPGGRDMIACIGIGIRVGIDVTAGRIGCRFNWLLVSGRQVSMGFYQEIKLSLNESVWNVVLYEDP